MTKSIEEEHTITSDLGLKPYDDRDLYDYLIRDKLHDINVVEWKLILTQFEKDINITILPTFFDIEESTRKIIVDHCNDIDDISSRIMSCLGLPKIIIMILITYS